MYTGEFWNKIYQEHSQDAPWLSESYKNTFINEYKKFIDTSVPQKILDYGCGNGQIGLYFMSPDIKVDFAEISDEQISKLNEQYGDKITTYVVNYPKDIPEKYDCIICSTVLHHVNPDLWSTFLDQFYDLLKPSGRLIISGADEEDYFLQSNHNLALMTDAPCWHISKLINLVDKNKYIVIDNYKIPVDLKAFKQTRTFRIIILDKKI